jgi:hypothetical protein
MFDMFLGDLKIAEVVSRIKSGDDISDD